MNYKIMIKLNNCIKNLYSTHILIRNLQQSCVCKRKWDLVAAVCVERKPIITPSLTTLEKTFQDYLSKLEYESSLKSDHELQHENDMKQQNLLKKGEIDLDLSTKQTAQDFLDVCNEELAKFKFADRITEADKLNDLKSPKRKLDKHLVLLTKQKLGKDHLFLLPQGLRQDGETLRQSAERVLNESCGNSMKTQFYGNAPCGFYKYTYPQNIQEQSGSIGSKVFVYFVRYHSGEPNTGVDLKWLDRSELEKELHPKYHQSLAAFLIDEK